MSRRKSNPDSISSSRAPARTPEQREDQLISLALDLAEKQLRDGTASSQVIAKLLQYGSQRERLEQEKIRAENSLLATKKEMLESEKRIESLYVDALNAMRAYSGNTTETIESDYDDFGD